MHLAVLDGSDVVYLEKIGDRMIGAIPTRVGGRQPAHCAAVGKAILAYSDEDDRGGSDTSARPSTRSPRRPQLTAELAKVRAHGVAFDREESLARIRLRRSADRQPRRSSRGGVGVWSDESDDVRSATGCPGADDRDGHLAQRRRRPARVAPTLQPLRPLLPRPLRVAPPAVRVNLDPQIAALIEALDAGFPPVHTMTGAQARAMIRSRFVPPAEPEPVAEVRDEIIPGPGGDIPVRIYRPDG